MNILSNLNIENLNVTLAEVLHNISLIMNTANLSETTFISDTTPLTVESIQHLATTNTTLLQTTPMDFNDFIDDTTDFFASTNNESLFNDFDDLSTYNTEITSINIDTTSLATTTPSTSIEPKVIELPPTTLSTVPKHIFPLEFFYGFFAATLTTLIFHPFDAIRLNQIRYNYDFLPMVRRMYHEQYRFYRALPISCLAYALTYAIYFAVSGLLKDVNYLNVNTRTLLAISAYLPAILCALTVTNPLWLVKTVQISSQRDLRVAEIVKDIYETHGIFGFQRGLLFGYINGLNSVVTFTFYDLLKESTHASTIFQFIICITLAKLLTYLLTYPFFVTRIHQHLLPDHSIWSIVHAYRNIRLAYSGLSVTLLTVLPRIAVLLATYETLKFLCEKI